MCQDAHKTLAAFCTKSDTFLHDYVAQTKHGDLTIGISTDRLTRGQVPTITLFCRFADPASAKAAGWDCNPHTGKWNKHFLDSRQVHNIITVIKDMSVCGQLQS